MDATELTISQETLARYRDLQRAAREAAARRDGLRDEILSLLLRGASVEPGPLRRGRRDRSGGQSTGLGGRNPRAADAREATAAGSRRRRSSDCASGLRRPETGGAACRPRSNTCAAPNRLTSCGRGLTNSKTSLTSSKPTPDALAGRSARFGQEGTMPAVALAQPQQSCPPSPSSVVEIGIWGGLALVDPSSRRSKGTSPTRGRRSRRAARAGAGPPRSSTCCTKLTIAAA